MYTCKTLLPLLLTLLLASAGCGTVQEPAPSATLADTSLQNNTQQDEKGQLELLIDKTASQAKEAGRTRKATLKDVVVEATPMWSLNYQGEVHIRVYDTAGNVILDEYRK